MQKVTQRQSIERAERARSEARETLARTHQNLHRLVTVTDGDVGRNLFVTADTERTDGVSRLGEDRLLTGELLQHLRGEKPSAVSLSFARLVRARALIHLASSVVHDISRDQTYLRRLREAITALPNANVEDELVNADGPHRVLSLLSLLNRAHDHSQSSSSTNARATSGATAQTSSRFKPFPRIHPHARSRPRITLARARRASLSPARVQKPYSPHRSPPSSPPRAPRARRLDTCASTFGALPLPRARAPLDRSARTMTFALVRQEKADDARASRAATPPHARTPEVSPFAPGPMARRRGVAVGRPDNRRGAVGRSLARSRARSPR